MIDPTANVVAILQAAVQRLDDLAALREHCNAEKDTQRRYYEDLLRDRGEQLRRAESARIDAIRAVDVGNVQRAADVAAAQADAIRQTVASTATAFDAKLIAVLEPLQTAIADLRRAQYETVGGKAQVIEQRGATGATYAAIGAGISFLVAVLAVLAYLTANGGP